MRSRKQLSKAMETERRTLERKYQGAAQDELAKARTAAVSRRQTRDSLQGPKPQR